MGRCGMRKVTMESKWPWNMKPRVTLLYYKCTSLYNGKKREPQAYPSLCVEYLVCVCYSPHTPCVCFNMVFNMVSERAIDGPAPNWMSHLCLWPVHICIFAAFREFLQQWFCKHFAAFRHWFWERAAFSDFAAFRSLFWGRSASEGFLNSDLFSAISAH